MIVYQERNDEGRRVTAEFYAAYCASKQQPTAIDRVSFLYGMQSFCRDQLAEELATAVDAMDRETALEPRISHSPQRPIRPRRPKETATMR